MAAKFKVEVLLRLQAIDAGRAGGTGAVHQHDGGTGSRLASATRGNQPHLPHHLLLCCSPEYMPAAAVARQLKASLEQATGLAVSNTTYMHTLRLLNIH